MEEVGFAQVSTPPPSTSQHRMDSMPMPKQDEKQKEAEKKKTTPERPGEKHEGMPMPGMAGQEPMQMDMHGHKEMQMKPGSFIEEIEQHGTSGTSAEPNATPMAMLMKMKGDWMFMFHGV